MRIEILSGPLGRGALQLTEQGLVSPALKIPFEEISEIAVDSLNMEHDPYAPQSGMMALSLLFGRPSWAIASNLWTGNTLTIRFKIRTNDERTFLAQSASKTFSMLKELYIGDDETEAPENQDKADME